jgi:CheY-like chemotaxis protein
MSGFEVKMIRANSRFKDVSIAIYSTSHQRKTLKKPFIEGANIYIKKPNDAKLKKSDQRSFKY